MGSRRLRCSRAAGERPIGLGSHVAWRLVVRDERAQSAAPRIMGLLATRTTSEVSAQKRARLALMDRRVVSNPASTTGIVMPM